LWQAPSGGAAAGGYVVEVGSSPGASNILVASLGPQLSLVATDVPNGVYYVRLRAIANGIVGPPSNEIAVTMAIGGCTGPPAAPGPVARAGSGNTVTLTWNAVAGATGYIVEAGSASGLANLAQAPVSATGLTAMAPNGTYFVRVRAVNACGAGPPSAEIVINVP
jgi:predicted phage tail protein